MIVPGTPALVSPTTSVVCRNGSDRRTTTRRAWSGFLLSGLVVCSACKTAIGVSGSLDATQRWQKKTPPLLPVSRAPARASAATTRSARRSSKPRRRQLSEIDQKQLATAGDDQRLSANGRLSHGPQDRQQIDRRLSKLRAAAGEKKTCGDHLRGSMQLPKNACGSKKSSVAPTGALSTTPAPPTPPHPTPPSTCWSHAGRAEMTERQQPCASSWARCGWGRANCIQLRPGT